MDSSIFHKRNDEGKERTKKLGSYSKSVLLVADLLRQNPHCMKIMCQRVISKVVQERSSRFYDFSFRLYLKRDSRRL